MAKAQTIEDTPAPEHPAQESVSKDVLERAIVTLANAQASQRIPQIHISRIKRRSPWNPSGDRKRPKLTRVTWLNGNRLRESRLSNDEIRGFNALVPGKYNGKKWFVSTREDEEGSAIDVYFPNKTPAHRIDFRSVCPRGLIDALNMMKDEAARAAA